MFIDLVAGKNLLFNKKVKYVYNMKFSRQKMRISNFQKSGSDKMSWQFCSHFFHNLMIIVLLILEL